MRILIAGLRLLTLLMITIVFSILVILFYFITPKNIWIYVVKLWSDCVIYGAGATVKVIGQKGRYQQHNTMVIANHISWLDIPVLYKLYALRFIGMSEVKRWLLLSLLIQSGRTIFINRNNKKDLLRVTPMLSQKLTDGDAIGFFPEGKTTDGSTILPFKPSLFEAAIIAKSQIIPVVILYYNKNKICNNEVSYVGKITLLQTVFNIVLLDKLHVKVVILPKVNAADFATREELATYLFTQIKKAYPVCTE